MFMFMLMESVAWAQGTGGSGGSGAGAQGPGGLLTFAPFILIAIIFYFLLIRPQQKRQKEQKALLDALKKGDKIVTTSGIWGTITNLGKETVTLQIADNTKIKMQRENIARVRGEDEDKEKDA
jgi:preprotein translocase subunit YajC